MSHMFATGVSKLLANPNLFTDMHNKNENIEL